MVNSGTIPSVQDEGSTPAEPTPPDTSGDAAPPAPRRRRRGVVVGGVLVLALGVGVGWYVSQQNQPAATTPKSELPTGEVVRTDLTSTFDIDGTLGYGESATVLGGGSGRITWLPKVGTEIDRGETACGVNGYRIPLFFGQAPLWRTLSQGVANGSDVRLLEQNLDALGYADDLTVDRSFTWATKSAVKKWQKAQGMSQTGIVAPGDAVVRPAAIRVTKVQAVLGGGAGSELFTASDTRKVVTVDVPVNEAQGVAREGAKVRVELPGGKKVDGTIASVGTVATSASGSTAQTGEGTENATVPVTINLDKKASKGTLDGAPATVGFASSVHKNVLAVPVNALLADAESKYSVNVVDAGGAVRAVPVELGIFDGDRVEVKGDLAEGAKVQVPKS